MADEEVFAKIRLIPISHGDPAVVVGAAATEGRAEDDRPKPASFAKTSRTPIAECLMAVAAGAAMPCPRACSSMSPIFAQHRLSVDCGHHGHPANDDTTRADGVEPGRSRDGVPEMCCNHASMSFGTLRTSPFLPHRFE
ncbi:Auxin response factor [Hordeum vulgare]|nr:Auxin response factor [Hordeum vulgare]